MTDTLDGLDGHSDTYLRIVQSRGGGGTEQFGGNGVLDCDSEDMLMKFE